MGSDVGHPIHIEKSHAVSTRFGLWGLRRPWACGVESAANKKARGGRGFNLGNQRSNPQTPRSPLPSRKTRVHAQVWGGLRASNPPFRPFVPMGPTFPQKQGSKQSKKGERKRIGTKDRRGSNYYYYIDIYRELAFKLLSSLLSSVLLKKGQKPPFLSRNWTSVLSQKDESPPQRFCSV